VIRRLACLLGGLTLTMGIFIAASGPAGAASCSPWPSCFGAAYQVSGTPDNSLWEWNNSPSLGGSAIRAIPNGYTLIVGCQANDGPQEDGKYNSYPTVPSTTWDFAWDGGLSRYVWVYDWWMNTPPQQAAYHCNFGPPPPPRGGAGPYQVIGTDSQGLAVQSQPHINHVVRWVPNGTTLNVACQVNNGDQVDGRTQYGRPFTTWDKLTDGTWVYDWYMTTAVVATDGYSPGMPHCAGGPPALTTSIAVPNLTIGGIKANGYTAGPLYYDGPGFSNAGRAESLAAAENSGFCQDMVMANTDFSWLWPDINYVARWPGDAVSNGRSVTGYPIVGAVVVFRPGNHYWSSAHYWNYGVGHVAMVVKADSSSYTVAEFNFNLGGGGRYIMDFRRIPWPDPYPTWGDGTSVAGFIR
jgi:hypothetical protein